MRRFTSERGARRFQLDSQATATTTIVVELVGPIIKSGVLKEEEEGLWI